MSQPGTRRRARTAWIVAAALSALVLVWGTIAVVITHVAGAPTVAAVRTTAELVTEPASAEHVGDVLSRRLHQVGLDNTIEQRGNGRLLVTVTAEKTAEDMLRRLARQGRLSVRPVIGPAPEGDPDACDSGAAQRYAVDEAPGEVTGCNSPSGAAYRLGAAVVTSADIASAAAASAGDAATVTLDFTPEGQPKFTGLTRRALHKQVALLVDGEVYAAPTIDAEIAGAATFSGQFPAAEATAVAAIAVSGPYATAVTLGRLSTRRTG